MIKAVIFDLDGVIVSTDELHYKAWKAMTEREGIYFNETINNRLRGVSRMASLEIILEKATRFYGSDEKQRLVDFKNGLYVESLKDLNKDTILPGVMDVLEELKRRGIKVAIGSSSRNAKLILERIDLLDYFDAISDGTNIKKSKPHPEVFLKAADMLGIEYSKCAVVEDAVSGIEAANAAGMLSFATGDATDCIIKDHLFEEILEII